MSNISVLYVVNSFINRRGNIGYRIGKITSPSSPIYISRGGKVSDGKNIGMGFFGHLPRILHALKMYVFPKFRYRLFDFYFFEAFFFLYARFKIKQRKERGLVAHVVEPSPRIIKWLKRNGYKVCLDVPIAPTSYVKRLSEERGGWYGLSDISYMYKYELASYNLADLIIVPSEFVKSELIKCGICPNKISLVPFGVTVPNYTKSYDSLIDKSKLDFCFAGVINSRKGIETLLSAYDCDELKVHNLHLCGRLTPEIKKIIKNKNLKNLHLPGFVNVNSYMSECDVYVFPSLLEGSSKSNYEAMAHGMPVITTFESGSVVRDGKDGFLIDALDVEQLRMKMLEFVFDRKKVINMGKSAARHVSQFTWEAYSLKLNEIYLKESQNL